jgi:predicted RNA-binding Zn-ribbon protein involved in translation (DUF1610 family)
MPKKEFRQCLPPFQDFKSRGPFEDKANGRMLIHLLKKGEPAKTWSYAKYLLSVDRGEELPKGIEADHKDGNRFNDALDNLQALPRKKNAKKSKTDPRVLAQAKLIEFVCPICGEVFIRNSSRTHLGKGSGTHAYCSRDCSRKWKQCRGKKQVFRYLPVPEIPTERRAEPWTKWSTALPATERYRLQDQVRVCPECGNKFSPKLRGQERCSVPCASKASSLRNARNGKEEFITTVRKVLEEGLSWEAAGRMLGVSGNAVKKRARNMGYDIPKRARFK